MPRVPIAGVTGMIFQMPEVNQMLLAKIQKGALF